MYKKILEISGHAGAVYTGVVDSNFLYSGSADHYVTRWNIEKGEQDKFAIKMDQSVYALEFISKNILAVGLSNGSLYLFDVDAKIELKHFVQHIKAIFSITSNALKNQFYVGDADGNLSVWNSKTLELLIYIPLDCGKIRDIHVDESGDLISVSCQDGTTRIFETVGLNEVITLNSHSGGATVSCFDYSNSTIILTGGKDAHLNLWNRETSALIKSIPAHNYVIYDICFLNSQFFATASRDKTIKIWDANKYEVIQRLDMKSGGHKHSVNKLIKINDETFVSLSDDKRIIVWSNK